jgi:hypothetical protein
MKTSRLLKLCVWSALSVLAPGVLADTPALGASVRALEGGQALLAIETHRAAIVERLVADHAEALSQRGLDADAFRSTLNALRADQLLAATLVSTLDEVLRVVREPTVPTGPTGQRYVAITPTEAIELRAVPDAQAYLVRDGEALSVVKAAELQLTGRNRVVGYFAPATTSVTLASTAAVFEPKDGSGSGSGSWIGYTAGFNQATGLNSAVAAGSNNLASAQGAFVGAGTANQANGLSSLVIGGFDNRAVGIDSLVGAGAGHRATGSRSVIVGGGYNLASGGWSFIGGGGRDGTESTPAGTDARDHVAAGDFSTIGGGQGNRTGPNAYSAVAGGHNNTASGVAAIVAGGQVNTASANSSAVGGGVSNSASGNSSTVAGGSNNIASGNSSTVAGGSNNITSGISSAVAGGSFNITSGISGTVAGGSFNSASGNFSAVAGGQDNSASGFASTVAGDSNTASGTASLAAGRRARTQTAGASPTIHNGVFIFADSNNFDFNSSAANEFAVRATGGARIVSAINVSTGAVTAGVGLAAGGGSWSSLSDRNAKFNFSAVDRKAILAKVAALDVSLWSYKAQGEGVRHIGPMAQDFGAAFGVGENNTTIATVDADGIALAAIQGLHEIVQEKEAMIRRQQIAIERLEARMTEIEALRAEMVMMKSALAEMRQERSSVAQRD